MPRPTVRLGLLLAVPLLLAACASPCDRIDEDFRQLNADVIRNPAIVTDGTYVRRFQDLAAESVEHQCLR